MRRRRSVQQGGHAPPGGERQFVALAEHVEGHEQAAAGKVVAVPAVAAHQLEPFRAGGGEVAGQRVVGGQGVPRCGVRRVAFEAGPQARDVGLGVGGLDEGQLRSQQPEGRVVGGDRLEFADGRGGATRVAPSGGGRLVEPLPGRVGLGRGARCLSSSARMAASGCTPTNCSTTWPWWNSITVGMLRMPNCPAMLLLLVGVHLGEREAAGVVVGDAVEHRHQRAARSAPGRPEIHQDGLLAEAPTTTSAKFCSVATILQGAAMSSPPVSGLEIVSAGAAARARRG